MAQATAYNMTSARGAREDLSDQLRRVEPQETPLYSLLPQSPAPKARFTEWNVDDLADPDIKPVFDGTDLQFHGSNAIVSTGSPGKAGNDGDFSFKFQNKARMGNRIQQLRTAFAVSPIAEMIDISASSSLYAESKAKATIELKRSIEVMIGSDEGGAQAVQQPANSGAGTPASYLGDISAGLGQFSNPDSSGSYWAGIGLSAVNYRPVSGSRLDLTSALAEETDTGDLVEGYNKGTNDVSLREMLQAVYEASGMKSNFRLFASPSVVNKITDFTRTSAGATRYNQTVSGGANISFSVVEYMSDWGTLTIIPDLWLGRTIASPSTAVTNRAYLLPADDTVSLKVMQGVTATDLPDIGGGGKRGFVSFISTLCVNNAKAIGSIV